MKLIKILGRVLGGLLLVGLLTLFTQVGGLIFLACLPFFRWIKKRQTGWKSAGLQIGGFLLIYTLVCALLIPPLARLNDRVPLPVFSETHLKPQHMGYAWFNRHYVKPALREVLIAQADRLAAQHPGVVLAYLDANFPFIDGLSLPPHLSHKDGKKVDLAFLYLDEKGKPWPRKARTAIAYGGVEAPVVGEQNVPARCRKQGYWMYNALSDLVGGGRENLSLDRKATRDMVRNFARDGEVGKLLLEPHLKQRWGLGGFNKIRFAGCYAVRHDDHLHVQLP
ncbi:MAG: hypothetical protein AAFR61_09130 [Bacteroidota bacterium]